MSGRRAIALVTFAAMCSLGVACSSDESSSDTTVAEETSEETTEGTTGTTEATTEESAEAAPDITEATAATEAVETTSPPSGDELSAETCTLLVELHEYNEAFKGPAVSGDLARLQQFDAERTPRAIEIYAELSGTMPEFATDIEQAGSLTAELSALIVAAETFDDVTSGMLALPDFAAENESVITIDELAVARCISTDTTDLDTTAVDTTDVVETSDPDDSTELTDGIDVIDDSVFDTIPEATDLPPVPTGADVTAELCTTLVGIQEWFETFNSMTEETNTWEELQEFDAAETPDVLQDFDDLAEMLPELEEQVADSVAFIEKISEVVQTADSYDEGSELLLGDEEQFNETMDQGLTLEAIYDYAVDECVDA